MLISGKPGISAPVPTRSAGAAILSRPARSLFAKSQPPSGLKILTKKPMMLCCSPPDGVVRLM